MNFNVNVEQYIDEEIEYLEKEIKKSLENEFVMNENHLNEIIERNAYNFTDSIARDLIDECKRQIDFEELLK